VPVIFPFCILGGAIQGAKALCLPVCHEVKHAVMPQNGFCPARRTSWVGSLVPLKTDERFIDRLDPRRAIKQQSYRCGPTPWLSAYRSGACLVEERLAELLQIHSHTRSAQGIRRLEILGRDG
jgi:hypothetical protein